MWNKINNKYKVRTVELWKISAPLMFEQIFITLMGMVSTMMSSNVGEYAVSAIGMVDSLNQILIGIFSALTTGGTIIIAQSIGRRDLNKAKTAGAQTIILNLFFSAAVLIVVRAFMKQIIAILFGNAEQQVLDAAVTFLSIVCFSFPVLAVTQAIFGVLRGTGNTRVPMYITIVMNVCNVIISFPLIFGFNIWFIHIPGFGVLGVAVGLLAARIIGLVIAVYYIIFIAYPIKLNGRENFIPKWDIQKNVLSLGIPTSVESSLFQVGKLITQLYIVSMGTASIAANSIGSSLFGFINMPGNAFGTAVMILVGQRIGRGEHDDVKPTSMFAVKFGTILMTMLCVAFFMLTNVFITLYNISPEASVFFKQIFYAALLVTPVFWPSAFIIPSALRATGDVKYTMVISLASMFMFRITIGYVLGIYFELGLLGVWIGMFSDWVVRSILFTIRLKKGKWQNKLLKG